MRILMVTPYLPYPPASGGQIRTLNLLRYLSKNNDIVLVALYKDKKEKNYSSRLKSFCSQIYLCKKPEKPWQFKILTKAIFSAKPLLIVRNYSDEASEVLNKLLKTERFDVIHAETFYVMPHIPQTNIPILLVEQTIEYKVYQHFVDSLFIFFQPLFYPDIVKLKYWERYYWKKASTVATVSIRDEKLIKKVEPKIFPAIIPNGAGVEMFVHRLPVKKLDNPILLFIGNFYWLQNKEAAKFLLKKIYPILKKDLRKFKIIIAGQEAKRVESENKENVEIINISPDDSQTVKALYKKATLFIAPIYGPGGTRLKILASMAAGLPVISTSTGLEGLNVEDRVHVLVANTPEEFAQKINMVLKNKSLYKNLQKKSYITAKEKYSWDAISKKLEIVYKTIQKQNEDRD